MILFVVPIIIAIVRIKRTQTHNNDANIKAMELVASFSISAYFLSLIGSIIAAVIFMLIIIAAIFMHGTAQITKREIIPAVPTAFFINCVPVITVSMLSDKKLPTSGIILPTANLAVFIPTLSSEGAQKPYIAFMPEKIVRAAVSNYLENDFNIFPK